MDVTNAISIALLIVLVGTGSGCRKKPAPALRPADMQQTFNALKYTIQQYAEWHDQKLPSSLQEAMSFSEAKAENIVHDKSNRNAGARLEYFYVNWSERHRYPQFVEQKYPLVYDDKMTYYVERGVNILLSDGSVFWDDDGKWLQQFASEHPDVTIPIPGD